MKLLGDIWLAVAVFWTCASCAPTPTAVVNGSVSDVWRNGHCTDAAYLHVENATRDEAVVVTDSRGVSRELFRQKDGAVLYAAQCGGALFVVSAAAEKLVPHDPSTGGKLALSADGGQTWRELPIPSRHGALGAECLDARTAYVWTDDEVLFTDDAGASWTPRRVPGKWEIEPRPRIAPDGSLWLLRDRVSDTPLVVRVDRGRGRREWRITTGIYATRLAVAGDGRVWHGGPSRSTKDRRIQVAEWMPGDPRPTVRFELGGSFIEALELGRDGVGALLWKVDEETLFDAPVYYASSGRSGQEWRVRRMDGNTYTQGCLSDGKIWHVNRRGELYLLPR
ncbi:MAG: hypothetical protein ABFD65_11040 [Candidatus Polarisedimenticolia bacterium]